MSKPSIFRGFFVDSRSVLLGLRNYPRYLPISENYAFRKNFPEFDARFVTFWHA